MVRLSTYKTAGPFVGEFQCRARAKTLSRLGGPLSRRKGVLSEAVNTNPLLAGASVVGEAPRHRAEGRVARATSVISRLLGRKWPNC
jgi:hypothetical protein